MAGGFIAGGGYGVNEAFSSISGINNSINSLYERIFELEKKVSLLEKNNQLLLNSIETLVEIQLKNKNSSNI